MICKSYESFFKTLAGPTRLEIINLLSKGPKSVTQLQDKLGYEQSRVSHSLRILEDRGFVTAERKGRKRIYSLDRKTIVPLLKLIDKHVDKYYHTDCRCKGMRWRELK